jgi:carbon storage regulator
VLVTMRRKGETLLIGEDIEVTIAHIGRSRVRVGIRAPQQYRVLPGERKADADRQPHDFENLDAGIQE